MKKGLLIVVVAMVVGIISGHIAPVLWQFAKEMSSGRGVIYKTTDPQLVTLSSESEPKQIGWNDLLPAAEREILDKYQNNRPEDPSEQILQSIMASTDQAYLDALYSMNTTEFLTGQLVSIPGYIVPLELDDERKVSSIFLVPYFGACLHYPAPAPNQIIYIRLPEPILMPDINQAYSVTGVLGTGLYEDLLGTSAYSLKLISLSNYFGQPDDFRQH